MLKRSMVAVIALFAALLFLGGSPAPASAATPPSLTFGGLFFGDGTGGLLANANCGSAYNMYFYDSTGSTLLNNANGSISIPLSVGTQSFQVWGDYFPFNPVTMASANHLELSLNGSATPNLVANDSAGPAYPGWAASNSTFTVGSYVVTLSGFSFTEHTPTNRVSPCLPTTGGGGTGPYAGAGDYTDVTASFTVSVAEIQNLSILGAVGTGVDTTTDWSPDVVAWDAGITSSGAWHFTGNASPTWRPAYRVGGHPWGQVPGTNTWLNCGPSIDSYRCGASGGNVIAFRVRFTLPTGSVNPNITFWINSDNAGTYYINGVQVTDRLVGGGGTGANPVGPSGCTAGSAPYCPAGVRTAAMQSALHDGTNEMLVIMEDWGGASGFNYRADISVIATSPIVIVPPAPPDSTPPVITPAVTGTLGNNGWYTSDVNVSWTVTDPESTVSSKTGCGPTTVTADTAGTTFTCTATSGGGTASKSVTIKRDATAPSASASRSGTPNGAGWDNADVTVTVTGTDSLSGIASCAAPVVLGEGAGQSAGGTCTDNAGNVSAPASVSGINIDKTAPVATSARSVAPNGAGWNNTDVTVTFAGTDGLSGVASCTAPAVLGEGAGQSASGTCTDLAGNVSAPATESNINIDKTAPTATATAAPAPNGAGWNNTDVTVTFAGADSLSGIASCTAPAVLGEGAGQSASGTCTDNAGNVSAPASVSNINVDKTAPAVQVTGVTNGASYVIGGVPAAGCTTSDALSGVATNAALTSNGGPIGSVTVTCAGATDKAGNASAPVTATYTVTYQLCAARDDDERDDRGGGSKDGHESGSTIPVKIRVCDANNRNLGSRTLTVQALGLSPSGSLNDSGKANPGNRFRFDDGTYIFNLSTKGLTAGNYTLDFTIGADPTVYHYAFTIRPPKTEGKDKDKGH